VKSVVTAVGSAAAGAQPDVVVAVVPAVPQQYLAAA